jgi:hypothetical protein
MERTTSGLRFYFHSLYDEWERICLKVRNEP